MYSIAGVIVTQRGQSEHRFPHEERLAAALQHSWPDDGISVSGSAATTEILLTIDGELILAWRAHNKKVMS